MYILHRCYGDQCAVATIDRELCMYEGVPQTVCENEGCCYDTMTSPNCYYSKDEGKVVQMQKLKVRELAGYLCLPQY